MVMGAIGMLSMLPIGAKIGAIVARKMDIRQ